MKCLLRESKYISLLLIVLIFSSCRKDIDVFTTINTIPIEEQPIALAGDINRFFEASEIPSEVHTFDVNLWQYIEGKKGTMLQIPRNCFVKTSGEAVTGMVDLKLIEIYEPKDMILGNKPTTTATGIIGSAGEVFIEVTQNGEVLALASGQSIRIQMPFYASNTDTFNDQMKVFYGEDNALGQFEWTVDTTTQVTNGFWENQEGYGESYDLDVFKLGWINCDFFWEYPDRTPLTIHVPEGYNEENTAVFLVFKDINAVCRVFRFEDGAFVSKDNYALPIGQEVIIVGIADIEDTYYGSIMPITMTENHEVTLVFEPITLAALNDALNQL